MKNNSKIATIAGILITILALGFSAFIIFNGSKEAIFTIDETTNTLEISGGLYSKKIVIDSTVAISMTDPLVIARRTNGSSVGNVKSGYFTLEGELAVYLNLGDSTHPWIEIYDGEDYFYINLKDEQSTLDLYNELLAQYQEG
ncbi:MAG: hypothetical protein JEZ05_02785 [Tenericutes bacterium]|nr:hypothetical protein [Mycoplasmatota bacterium]